MPMSRNQTSINPPNAVPRRCVPNLSLRYNTSKITDAIYLVTSKNFKIRLMNN